MFCKFFHGFKYIPRSVDTNSSFEQQFLAKMFNLFLGGQQRVNMIIFVEIIFEYNILHP